MQIRPSYLILINIIIIIFSQKLESITFVNAKKHQHNATKKYAKNFLDFLEIINN
jgi:hypothetical protein